VLHAHARELPLHPRLAEISRAVDDLLARAVSTELPSSALLGDAQQRIEAIVR
jgi:multiple sugar transport system substrate-binding protein